VKREYDDAILRRFTVATVVWALFGFSAGVVIALQLAYPQLNLDLPWTTFGRLRPLHTSAVVFAFGGNALIDLALRRAAHLPGAALGGQPRLVRVLGLPGVHRDGATGYLLGITQSREYAEPEWYVDIWLTIVWVAYLALFLGTLFKRKEPHIYVANWFYLAFIVTIAMLHVVNNLAMPVSRSARRATPPSPACRMRSSSGGTATTRWASSSPPASSA
jgi:cytochrome c oxidase cbb3-type subunit 1